MFNLACRVLCPCIREQRAVTGRKAFSAGLFTTICIANDLPRGMVYFHIAFKNTVSCKSGSLHIFRTK